MPLEHSSSPAALHRNMHTLMGDIGKSPHVQSRAQAIAIALSTQRRARANGGVAPGFDSGGSVDPVQAVINALQGSTSGVAGTGTMGATNQAAPSSPSMTANSQQQQPPTGLAPAAPAVPAIGPTTVTNPATGVATTSNPIQKPLMRDGGALKRASGGFDMAHGPQLRPPSYERMEDRQLHIGPVLSNVPGRTDNHQVRVPAGSYVFPAHHVSSMGDGNTLAGLSSLGKMFGTGPYGAGVPHLPHGSLPHPPRPPKFADGGTYHGGVYHPVDVDISGGEYVAPPWALIKRYGSLKKAHAFCDHWVMTRRKAEIAKLKRLPPPAKK